MDEMDVTFVTHLNHITLKSLLKYDSEVERKLKNYPYVMDIIQGLLHNNENKFIIAGGFAAFLLNKTPKFGDVDIFFFGYKLNLTPDWARVEPDCDIYSYSDLDRKTVYKHRYHRVDLVWVPMQKDFPYVEGFFYILDDFDSHLVKKGISLVDYAILDIDWGNCKFSTKRRNHKYFIKRNCKKIFNPEPLRLSCLKIYNSCLYK